MDKYVFRVAVEDISTGKRFIQEYGTNAESLSEAMEKAEKWCDEQGLRVFCMEEDFWAEGMFEPLIK